MSSVFGGGGDAGGDAAAAQAEANLAATEEIRRQFDITQANLDPFVQAGISQIPRVEQQTTLGGLDAFFAQLFGQGDPRSGGISTQSGPATFEQVINPEFGIFNDETARLQELIDTGSSPAQINNIDDFLLAQEKERLGLPPDMMLSDEAQAAQDELDALGISPSEFMQQQVQQQQQGGGGQGNAAFRALVDERQRAVQGQLSAGGLTRSGTALQEAARIPTDLGFQIEQLLSGRTSALAGSGQNAAAQLGAFGSQASGGVASLLQQTGSAAASGILADQQASAAAGQNILNTAATIGSIFFSDPALKENVEEIGENNGLKIYQWDWLPETKGTMIEGCGNIGFMADEVNEKYPQHIYEFGGFMMIDYPALLDELEEEFQEAA